MDPSLNKFRDKFYEEANQLLDRVEKDLLELEKRPGENDLIESAFRAIHTIKGVSGMFGFDFVCEFTHNLENVFQLVRDKGIAFNREVFDLTFASVDHIRRLITDQKLTEKHNRETHNRLLQSVAVILGKHQATITVPPAAAPKTAATGTSGEINTWHILFRTDEKLYFRGISLVGIFAELSQIGNYQIMRLDYLSDNQSDAWSVILSSNAGKSVICDIFLFVEENVTVTLLSEHDLLSGFEKEETGADADRSEAEQSIIDFIEKGGKLKVQPAADESVLPAKVGNTEAIETSGQSTKRISVESEKLDHLMFLVSELITVNSRLLLSCHEEQFAPLKPLIEKVDALSRLFRNNAFDLRLVPLSDSILRFQRLVRDLSLQLGKKIELVTHGTETELDKNTIDKLNEPLMHIIRNCADHGIEDPGSRFRAGKPETGTIRISANQTGNFVVILVEDDGAGINTEKVRLKAVNKGIIKATDDLTREQIIDCIFLPGFSTAESISEVSGRGVGMDVVRKKINELHVDVLVHSKEGAGTSFTLKIQQSVAIIDSLLFTVEDSFFTVPLSDILICSQIGSDEVIRRSHTSTLPFDNQLIPFVDLRKRLHIEGVYTQKVKVVILRNNNQLVALLTDRIVGEHQAVLKPLGRSFRNQEYITSASQLGDGNLAFMIDTSRIFKSVDMNKKDSLITN